MKKKLTRFDENDLKYFEPEAKVGLIATVNPEGLPHITLITALQAKTPNETHLGTIFGRTKQTECADQPEDGLSYHDSG